MPDSAQVTYEKGKLYDLNIADVQPDPDQPRKYFDEEAEVETVEGLAGEKRYELAKK